MEREAPVTTADPPARLRCELPVTGMTCAACARRVERQLQKAPGVRHASVNFATGRATVEYDPSAVNTRRIVELVEEAGYGTVDAARAWFTLVRPPASAEALEARLCGVPGVLSVQFEGGTLRLAVTYLPGVADVRTLRRAVEEHGDLVREASGSGGAVDEDSLATAASERCRCWAICPWWAGC
jgi:Cu+-exporting ATPase